MAESIKVQGRVIKVEAPVSVGAKGFRKAQVVIETMDEKYAQKIPIEAGGKNADLFEKAGIKEGDVITLECNLRGSEWNGKYYLKLEAWKGEVNSSRSNDGTKDMRVPTPVADDDNDSLPF